MRKIFMQVVCGYPHKGAAANYLENLAKAFVRSGYKVFLISDMNKEYSVSDSMHFDFFDGVYEIAYSKDETERSVQKEHGFVEDRLEIMKNNFLSSNDIVFLYNIWNEYMLEKLFSYREKIGFKIICGVTELFSLEDYRNEELGKKRIHTYENYFSESDAILTVSDYIFNFYRDRHVDVYKMPPFIEFNDNTKKESDYTKKRFLISTGKDSFENLLSAFCSLKDKELEEIELHICGVSLEIVKSLVNDASWNKIAKTLIVHKWMRYEEMLHLYEKMHYLIIARTECQRTLANFPSKVPETMAYGIVPVVSDVGDYTKYYLENEKNSIFINGDSVEEIVKSIRKAMALSKEEYDVYAKEAKKCAKVRFDYQNWIHDINNMIESV